jgi:hypothetical protein
MNREMIYCGVILSVMVVLVGCSDDVEVGPSAFTNAIFLSIDWPEKYEDGGNIGDELFKVSVSKFEHEPTAICWATFTYRECPDDQEDEPFDTEVQEVTKTGGDYWFSLDYSELGRRALEGVYTIRMGVCAADSDYYFDPWYANETHEFTKYLGPTHYRHDVEFEYIWQSGGFTDYDVFDNAPGGNWINMLEPFQTTLVHFEKVECDSNPVCFECVFGTDQHMDIYVRRYAMAWPGKPDQLLRHYILCSVPAMLEWPSGSELNVLGQTNVLHDYCFIAVGKIRQRFTTQIHEVRVATLAHEFGFAIGPGLLYQCHHPDSHSVNFDCVMGAMVDDPYGTPGWGCPGQSPVPIVGDPQFCPMCIDKLNSVDHLTDESWMK